MRLCQHIWYLLIILGVVGCVSADSNIAQPKDAVPVAPLVSLATGPELLCMNTIIGGMPIGTRNGYRFFAHETFERTVGKRVLDYQIYSLRKAGSPCSYVFANEVESGLPEYSLDETLALGSFDNDDIDTDIIAMAGSYAAECIDFFQGTLPDENIGRQIEAFSAGQPDAKAKRACFGALSSFLRGEGFRVLRLVEGESLYREVIFLQHKVYEE